MALAIERKLRGCETFGSPRKTTLWSPPAGEFPHHSVLRVDNELPRFIDFANNVECLVPTLMSDVEVIRRISYNVKSGDLLRV